MDLGSEGCPERRLWLKPRPSRCAATCRRACYRRAARRGPPGRSAVSWCQWQPSGLETVSNTCPCIGSFALVDQKSCVRTPQSPGAGAGRCRIDLRPPGHLTVSALGTEPVKHARAMYTARRHLPLRRRRRATLTRSTNSRTTGRRKRDKPDAGVGVNGASGPAPSRKARVRISATCDSCRLLHSPKSDHPRNLTLLVPPPLAFPELELSG